MGIKQLLSELFYPSGIKCIVCEDELPYETEYGLCERCKLPQNDHFCQSCGKFIPDMADFCDDCQAHANAFSFARAPLVYEDDVIKLVRKLKYGDARYLAGYFARFMQDTYDGAHWNADVVTYVPMHRRRQRQRGYNQAQLIARALAKRLGLPLYDWLKRACFTKNFARMTRTERITAVKGTIQILPDADCRHRSVLLVDDVFTTGSTVNECARVLKEAGAAVVYVITAATGRVRSLLIP